MTNTNNGSQDDITGKYYSMWNDYITWLPNVKIKLKDIYCLPDVCNQHGEFFDLSSAFDDIATSKITLLLGEAGIGKSSFISYLCNNIQILGTDTGIIVWTFPLSTDNIQLILHDCSQYSRQKNYRKIILVFEDDQGYKTNISDICKTIRQQQDKWFPNINVILTCRKEYVKKAPFDCYTLTIQPFSIEKVSLLTERFNRKVKDASYTLENIQSLFRIFGAKTIGNPVTLLTVLSSFMYNDAINSASDLYSLLFNNSVFKENLFLLEIIASLLFTVQNHRIPIRSLYLELCSQEIPFLQNTDISTFRNTLSKKLRGICVISERYIQFEHILYYHYSLACFLLHQIEKTDFSDNVKNASLSSILASGELSPEVFSFFGSLLKATNQANKDNIQNKVVNYYLYILGKGKAITKGKNTDTSFSFSFEQEMVLFYNVTSIYHSVLINNHSNRLFTDNNPAINQFLFYLKMYSSIIHAVIDLSEMDFRRFDFSNLNLLNINFSYCNLGECCFDSSKLTNVQLISADLHGSNLQKTQLIESNFKNANLRSALLTDSMIISCNMESSNLHCANLNRSILKNVDFSNANLRGADFDSVICKNVNFRSANLTESYLANVIFNDVVFDGTNLNGAFMDRQGIKEEREEG